MALSLDVTELTYQQRIDALRDEKLRCTREKQTLLGDMDFDDWGQILPPEDQRDYVHVMSPSGIMIRDSIIKGFEVASNHPSGGFFGPKAVGENYRALLERHPVTIDPLSSLAGAYMLNFTSYRRPHWNPDLRYDHLKPVQEQYQLLHGIGGMQHLTPDIAIGLRLGWGGLLDHIRTNRASHGPEKADFYDGLEAVVLGAQNWVQRHADAARALAETEDNPQRRQNLFEIADVNAHIVSDPPGTFRGACQWLLWYEMVARMYNGSGAVGQLDVLLLDYYEADVAAGRLTDDEATFHIACMLLLDTMYCQLGGPDRAGRDVTNPVSFLVLEAAHWLKIPANVAIAVGRGTSEALLRRGVEIMLEDKTGIPKFLGVDNTVPDFAKNGYPLEDGRDRKYSGCNWCGIPGREYGMNDLIKINLAVVFDVALHDMLTDPAVTPSLELLEQRFEDHLRRAVATIAQGIDFHIAHMHEVFPELVLDLCCTGPIERGEDASHGGLDYTNIAVDGAGLATTADSFAAIRQRIVDEGRLTWADLLHYLDTDWAGPDGERARLMMKHVPHYGHGGTLADDYAARLSQLYTRLVLEHPTPSGVKMLPGLFSWAYTVKFGEHLGATPNGRHAGDLISHGANPDPGFRKDGAPTAMAAAVAAVQPGYGNTAPLQIELDMSVIDQENAVEVVSQLIRSHFELGGTQINMNILDKQKVLEAHIDPSRHPDLVVRVTGFSAYFASLSPEFRQMVVNRILADD